MQERVITHPVRRQFCHGLPNRHACSALERISERNCSGRMGFPHHRITRLKKGPIPAAISKWTHSGMFQELWHTQADHNVHKRERILPPLSQNKALSSAWQEKQENSRNRTKKITFWSDGNMLPPADERKQGHLELRAHCTLVVPSLDTRDFNAFLAGRLSQPA